MQHVATTNASFRREGAGAASYSLHQVLTPFPVAYFTGALATDLAYWRTAEVMWENFSAWLITAGLLVAGLAMIAAGIDLAAGGHKPAWGRATAYLVAVLLGLVNVFVHSRDAYTAVVPTGLMLSAVVVIILLGMAPTGWVLTSPRHSGANA
ncbi:DUF2231 domain-containing protein [Bradyrhizobium sp. ARR65]|uniref:DUF2231 domain-containing protein n=1 Tax=Bradyrhizobium sp. ARR65 TaxID=1040989 RepID=UPI0004666AB0|nr:DUF2231 domain-containing protein [Bradyrhizobium sp. ARR65]